jgi:ribosome-associated translation inhibitor RaiA
MTKERLEGSGAARLIQLIRQHGYNVDVNIEMATVTSAPPDLKIKVDNMKVELDRDDIIVAQSLTKHKRQVKIDGGATVELEYQDELKVGDRVIVASANNDQLYFVIDKAVIY